MNDQTIKVLHDRVVASEEEANLLVELCARYDIARFDQPWVELGNAALKRPTRELTRLEAIRRTVESIRHEPIVPKPGSLMAAKARVRELETILEDERRYADIVDDRLRDVISDCFHVDGPELDEAFRRFKSMFEDRPARKPIDVAAPVDTSVSGGGRGSIAEATAADAPLPTLDIQATEIEQKPVDRAFADPSYVVEKTRDGFRVHDVLPVGPISFGDGEEIPEDEPELPEKG